MCVCLSAKSPELAHRTMRLDGRFDARLDGADGGIATEAGIRLACGFEGGRFLGLSGGDEDESQGQQGAPNSSQSIPPAARTWIISPARRLGSLSTPVALDAALDEQNSCSE